MVPRALLADLDDVDTELAVLVGHRLELTRGLDPTLVGTELVAVDVAQLGQRGPAADRALSLGGLAVELGRPQQIGVGVAHVGSRGTAPPQGVKGRPTLHRVVDDRPLGPHPVNGRTGSPAAALRRPGGVPDLAGTWPRGVPRLHA